MFKKLFLLPLLLCSLHANALERSVQRTLCQWYDRDLWASTPSYPTPNFLEGNFATAATCDDHPYGISLMQQQGPGLSLTAPLDETIKQNAVGAIAATAGLYATTTTHYADSLQARMVNPYHDMTVSRIYNELQPILKHFPRYLDGITVSETRSQLIDLAPSVPMESRFEFLDKINIKILELEAYREYSRTITHNERALQETSSLISRLTECAKTLDYDVHKNAELAVMHEPMVSSLQEHKGLLAEQARICGKLKTEQQHLDMHKRLFQEASSAKSAYQDAHKKPFYHFVNSAWLTCKLLSGNRQATYDKSFADREQQWMNVDRTVKAEESKLARCQARIERVEQAFKAELPKASIPDLHGEIDQIAHEFHPIGTNKDLSKMYNDRLRALEAELEKRNYKDQAVSIVHVKRDSTQRLTMSPVDATIAQKRIKAANRTVSSGGAIQYRATSLSPRAVEIIKRAGVPTELMSKVRGNFLQLEAFEESSTIFQDLLEVNEHAASQPLSTEEREDLNVMTDATTTMCALSNELMQEGHYKEGFAHLDGANALLDSLKVTYHYAKPVAKGLAEGSAASIRNLVNMVYHPVETVCNIAEGVKVCGSAVLKCQEYVYMQAEATNLHAKGKHTEAAQCAERAQELRQDFEQFGAVVNKALADFNALPIEDKLEKASFILGHVGTDIITGKVITRGIRAISSLPMTINAQAKLAALAAREVERIKRLSRVIALGTQLAIKVETTNLVPIGNRLVTRGLKNAVVAASKTAGLALSESEVLTTLLRTETPIASAITESIEQTAEQFARVTQELGGAAGPPAQTAGRAVEAGEASVAAEGVQAASKSAQAAEELVVDARNAYHVDDLPHIFDDRPGHLPYTPENCKLLEELASSPENYVLTDARGSHWFEKTQSDGTQLWTEVRNNKIRNGGINLKPIQCNPRTGMKKIVPPKKGGKKG